MNKFHRYISFFLCLALILFCLSSPLQRSASASATATIVIGIAGSTVSVEAVIGVVATILVAVGLASGTVDQVVDQATLFYNNCSASLKKWFDGVAADVIDGTSVFRIPSNVQNELKDKLNGKVPDNIPYLLIPGTLTNLASLTGADVFIQDVVGAIEAGNSLQEITNTRLLGLHGLLNTSFAELEDFISSQTSSITNGFTNIISKANSINSNVVTVIRNLDTLFGSLEISVDAMSSSLSKDLKDLKTLYSSFGNETLTKLDTLNTTIESLTGFDSSEDFADLKYLYSTFGNETLSKLDDLVDSIENIPYTFSDTIAGQFTDLSVKLDQVISKLGDDFSFVEVISQNQDLLLTDLSAYFYRVISTLESLDVTASVDLQPLIDQISVSELNLNSFLESLYDLQASYLSSLETTLYNQFDYIASLYLEDYLVAFNNGFALLNETLYEVWSDTSNLVEVKVSLEELVGSDLLTSGTFTNVIESNIGALTSTVDHYGSKIITDVSSEIANLKTELLDTLNDVKTAVQSIAGTTTADPGGNNSQNEYEKEKAPLIPYIGSGFDIGGKHFNSVQGYLAEEMEAFLVAGMIFEEFAGMTFFYKLIIISCSVGLIGTLLGMALQLQGYSVAQRRREEAAQARAHVRMERSAAA